MLNLTPHTIRIMNPETGEVIELPPSGRVARVTTEVFDLGSMWIGTICVPIQKREFGEVEGLPDEGTPCIVSGMVASAVPGRSGVYAPDTGPSAVRREGQVWAVTRLNAA